jgi:hypothetical protein
VNASRTTTATRSSVLLSPNVFLDYPKFGVWRDGYYMSANEFPDGQQTSSGAAAVVFERSQMLNGQPARYVYFDESAANPLGGQYIGQLPGDADGTKLPPAGEPNVFAEIDDPSGIPPTGSDAGFDMRIWKFHVDWANPQSSTFGNNGQPSFTIPVAPFVRPQCVYGYGDCVLQRGAHRAWTCSVTGSCPASHTATSAITNRSCSTTPPRWTRATGSAGTRCGIR